MVWGNFEKSVVMLKIKGMLIYLLIALLVAPAIASAGVSAKHHTLRVDQFHDSLRVMMELTGATKYKYFSLAKPDRLVVDLIGVINTGKPPKLNFEGSPIKGIRLGIRKGNNLRMVFDLRERVEAQVKVEQIPGSHRHRVVIALSGYSTTPAQTVAAKPSSVVRKSVGLSLDDEVVEKTIIRSENSYQRVNRDIVVAIDAGHGGADPGARGYNGTYEKTVVLAIARRLKALIEKEDGMRPIMIRDGDQYIGLRQRMEKAQVHQADLFVSIHADAFDDHRVRGASVYTLSRRGATTEAARLLADRENSADIIGFLEDNQDDMLAQVLIDLSQNATSESSMDVASRVLNSLGRVNLLHKRRVEQAGFMVLKSPDIPSILIETAFISNPDDEKNLLSSRHQQKMANAVMKGVRGYFKANPPQGTRLAAREHVIRRGDTLSAIAERYDVSLSKLRTANALKGDRLFVGRVLQIPLTGG